MQVVNQSDLYLWDIQILLLVNNTINPAVNQYIRFGVFIVCKINVAVSSYNVDHDSSEFGLTILISVYYYCCRTVTVGSCELNIQYDVDS